MKSNIKHGRHGVMVAYGIVDPLAGVRISLATRGGTQVANGAGCRGRMPRMPNLRGYLSMFSAQEVVCDDRKCPKISCGLDRLLD